MIGGQKAAGCVVDRITAPVGNAAHGLGSLLLLSCVVIWGVNAVAFKVGGHTFDPVLLNGLRFLAVAPCIALIVLARDPGALRVQNRGDLLRYALYGLSSIALSESLMALAARHTSVANVTLLGPGTVSLFTALWAVALKEQTLTRFGWAGAVVALLGVGMVATGYPLGAAAARGGAQSLRLDDRSLFGDGIALLRSVIQGGYLLLLTRTLRERSVLTVTVYNVVFGALWLLPYVVWRAPEIAWARVPQEAWWSLLWTIVPTTVYGFLAWNWGMRQVGAVAATNLFYLIPVFAALAAWALLHEPLTAGQVLGGVVIVAGIVLLRWDTLLSARPGTLWVLPRPRLGYIRKRRI